MGERCARWFRVSTTGQAEDNQVPEVDGHIAARGYEVARTFALHAFSASEGEQEPALAEVIADMTAGRYTVLVCAHSSRLDRREDLDLQAEFLIGVRRAGGRVESAREPGFGQTDRISRFITMLAQDANAEYSRTLKGHIGAAMRARAAAGSFTGSEPWGAVSVGPEGGKHLVATDAAHRYGPQILERVAAGQSLGEVARWLTAQGVAPGRGEGTPGRPWWAKSVAGVVRSKTLLGSSPCSYTVAWTGEDGKHSETLRWVHRFDAVADHDLWLAANKALDERGERWAKGQAREGRRAVEPLSGVSRCQHCWAAGADSPMYRLSSGNLRCTGRGPDRRGCGLILPVTAARALADMAFGQMSDGLLYAIYERRRVPGNAAWLEVRRDELEQREREIANSAMTRAERRAATAELDATFDELDATEIIGDTEELLPTGENYAAYWARLDGDGRRGFLRGGEFSVRFGRADGTQRCELDGFGIWVDALGQDDSE
jgi:DNA invertase Pin-like site-specific DNA recombinase